MKKKCITALWGLLTAAALPLHAEAPDPWDLWLRGGQLAEKGQTEEAVNIFRSAAAAWENSAAGSLDYYNAGTAWALGENPAQAMVNFHRALRVDPYRGDAAYNLDRLRKQYSLEPPVLDPGMRVWILWGTLAAGSLGTAVGILLLSRTIRRKGGLRSLGQTPALLVLAGGIISGTLGLVMEQKGQSGVISAEYGPRLGDGEFYHKLEGGPWKPGQEVFVLEERAGWIRGKTAVRDGWVPERLLLRP